MQLQRMVLGDAPRAWRDLGFEVSDTEPGSGELTLANTVITLTGSGGGFLGWHLDGVNDDIDGLKNAGPGPMVATDTAAPGTTAPDTTAPDTTAPDTTATEHRNGISRIDHVVISTGDCDRTAEAFVAAGLVPRGGRSTDSYGSPMREIFMWAGDVILELVGPEHDQPRTDAPTAIFGLAFVADDLTATARRLGELMGTPKDAVQPGRHIAGLRGAKTGVSLRLAVMSPHPGSATTA